MDSPDAYQWLRKSTLWASGRMAKSMDMAGLHSEMGPSKKVCLRMEISGRIRMLSNLTTLIYIPLPKSLISTTI